MPGSSFGGVVEVIYDCNSCEVRTKSTGATVNVALKSRGVSQMKSYLRSKVFLCAASCPALHLIACLKGNEMLYRVYVTLAWINITNRWEPHYAPNMIFSVRSQLLISFNTCCNKVFYYNLCFYSNKDYRSWPRDIWTLTFHSFIWESGPSCIAVWLMGEKMMHVAIKIIFINLVAYF